MGINALGDNDVMDVMACHGRFSKFFFESIISLT